MKGTAHKLQYSSSNKQGSAQMRASRCFVMYYRICVPPFFAFGDTGQQMWSYPPAAENTMDGSSSPVSGKRRDVEDALLNDAQGSTKRLKRSLTQESDLKVQK